MPPDGDTAARDAGGRPHPPNWLHDAARSTLEDLRLFARTLWAVTARPQTFARGWAEGTLRPQNPLAFVALCASVASGFFQALQWIGLSAGDESFGQQLLNATGPFAQYAIIGGLAHIAMLAVRPRRRLLDSLGIALYAGGPALVAYTMNGVALGAIWLSLGRPAVHNGLSTLLGNRGQRVFTAGVWLEFGLFARSLWLGLAGLHSGRRTVTALATLAAVVVLALLLGWLDVHGPFGMQLVLVHRGHGWDFGFHD